MRLGLLLAGSRPVPEALDLARRAEAAGIEEIWVSEDYFERGAFVLAAATAAVTSRPTIGIGVVNPWTRHPLLTAMEFAALDELAAGRAALGLGASNPVWMQERAGIRFTHPLEAIDESVQIIRAALGGRRVAHAGRHFAVDAQLSFEPGRADPPIYIGAKGPRALALAAQVADGVLLSLLSAPAYLSWARHQLPPQQTVSAYVLAACQADRGEARDSVRATLAFYLGVHGDHAITRVPGLEAEQCAVFRAGWVQGRPAEHLVTDQIIDTFAIAGDPTDCARGLEQLRATGLDCAILRDPGDSGVEGLLDLAGAHTSSRTEGAAR